MTAMAAHVHIVDDDPRVRRALERLLATAGYRCETYASAEALLAVPADALAGCAIVDIHLPGASGLDLQDRLERLEATLPLVFLTGRGDIPTSVRAMKGGAVDFLTKPVEAKPLLAAVEAALERARTLTAAHEAEAGLDRRLGLLTPREREVLDGVVEGRINKQIAGDLGIAEKTVKVHRSRVMEKLGVRTIADLVRLMVGHRR